MGQGLVRDQDKIRKAVSGLSRPLLELTEDAVRLGWKLQLGNAGVLVLLSPGLYDDNEKIVVPRNEKHVRDRVLNTWHRKIRRYAKPEALTEADKVLIGTIPESEGEEEPVRTMPPPGRPVEEVQLPTPADLAGLKLTIHPPEEPTAEELADGPVTGETPEVQVAELVDGQWVEIDGMRKRACTKCDPPVFFQSNGWNSHQRHHKPTRATKAGGRQLRCRYPGCNQTFSGPNSGFRRGQHERFQHKRGEPIVTAETNGLMPAADALDMVVATLREAGVVGDDARVAELTAQLAVVTKQRDDALEELEDIKKVFKRFAGD